MKKLLTLLTAIFCAAIVNAGPLADKFNDFCKMDCVTTYDITSEFKEMHAKTATMATATPTPDMIKFPLAFEAFKKSLPANCRLNKGELKDGEPEIFFYQPAASSNAEIISISYGEKGINAVIFCILPPKDAREFKAEF